MEKHIPYEKLSKKKQRELNRKRRNTWGSLSPVTRNTANPKAYNRQKARKPLGAEELLTFIPRPFRILITGPLLQCPYRLAPILDCQEDDAVCQVLIGINHFNTAFTASIRADCVSSLSFSAFTILPSMVPFVTMWMTDTVSDFCPWRKSLSTVWV